MTALKAPQRNRKCGAKGQGAAASARPSGRLGEPPRHRRTACAAGLGFSRADGASVVLRSTPKRALTWWGRSPAYPTRTHRGTLPRAPDPQGQAGQPHACRRRRLDLRLRSLAREGRSQVADRSGRVPRCGRGPFSPTSEKGRVGAQLNAADALASERFAVVQTAQKTCRHSRDHSRNPSQEFSRACDLRTSSDSRGVLHAKTRPSMTCVLQVTCPSGAWERKWRVR